MYTEQEIIYIFKEIRNELNQVISELNEVKICKGIDGYHDAENIAEIALESLKKIESISVTITEKIDSLNDA